MTDGSIFGVIHLPNGDLRYEPYTQLLKDIINSNNADLLRHFILTVGIVSNHGNWFTSNEHNKELRVLAQSYDWLLFLTDAGLAKFVETLLLKENTKYQAIREAFINSYTGKANVNKFTKVNIALEADQALQQYFKENITDIESWFNVISPMEVTIQELKTELEVLSSKNWKEILK